MNDQPLPVNAPIYWWTAGILFTALFAAAMISRRLRTTGRIDDTLYRELILRIQTWAWITPAVLIPVGFGPIGIRIGTMILALLCYREFSRATALERNRGLHYFGMAAVLGLSTGISPESRSPEILAVVFASLGVVGLVSCPPTVFLQSVSLAAIAVAWFGICLGSLAEFADKQGHVLIVLWLIICVELSDVAAFIGGKLLKGRKLCPQISPGKTVSGAMTALVVTTVFAGVTAEWFWQATATWIPYLIGLVIAFTGQLGDLVVSAVKRSLDVKDLGRTLPGHGGILDRCDSLLLAAPATLFAQSILAMVPVHASSHL